MRSSALSGWVLIKIDSRLSFRFETTGNYYVLAIETQPCFREFTPLDHKGDREKKLMIKRSGFEIGKEA
jgi:hypothetical protein